VRPVIVLRTHVHARNDTVASAKAAVMHLASEIFHDLLQKEV